MEQHFIEATNNQKNWGKFLLMRFDQEEWQYQSQMAGGSLLRQIGWNPEQIWVLDLQTCEGCAVVPGGSASHDLNEKHRIWICPLYEPFLEWLYRQTFTKLSDLPAQVNLEDAEFMFQGHRRKGNKINEKENEA